MYYNERNGNFKIKLHNLLMAAPGFECRVTHTRTQSPYPDPLQRNVTMQGSISLVFRHSKHIGTSRVTVYFKCLYFIFMFWKKVEMKTYMKHITSHPKIYKDSYVINGHITLTKKVLIIFMIT